jgi:hypothetical protein
MKQHTHKQPTHDIILYILFFSRKIGPAALGNARCRPPALPRLAITGPGTLSHTSIELPFHNRRPVQKKCTWTMLYPLLLFQNLVLTVIEKINVAKSVRVHTPHVKIAQNSGIERIVPFNGTKGPIYRVLCIVVGILLCVWCDNRVIG